MSLDDEMQQRLQDVEKQFQDEKKRFQDEMKQFQEEKDSLDNMAKDNKVKSSK